VIVTSQNVPGFYVQRTPSLLLHLEEKCRQLMDADVMIGEMGVNVIMLFKLYKITRKILFILLGHNEVLWYIKRFRCVKNRLDKTNCPSRVKLFLVLKRCCGLQTVQLCQVTATRPAHDKIVIC